MNRRVTDLLGITRPRGEDTPLWSGLAAALGAVTAALFAILVQLPAWTVILFFVLAVCALGILAWRLATDPPEQNR